MSRILFKNKAQTTLEYAVLIGVIVAALIVMQTYVKRGFQGKVRESADNMGEQFSPGHTTYNYNTDSHSVSTETQNLGVTTTDIAQQESNKAGGEHVDNLDQENWPE